MNTISSRSWLGITLLLDAIGLSWAALEIFHVSSGSGRALLFGLSAQSLLLIGLTLLAALALLALGLLTWRGKLLLAEKLAAHLLKSPAWMIGGLTVIALAGWLLACTPAERFAGYYYYALRLLPLAGWLAWACGTGAVFLLVAQRGINPAHFRAYLRQNRGVFLVGAVVLVIILLVAWLASVQIFDAAAEEDFWYGAGVPVLAWQVLTAIIIGLAAAWVEKKFLDNGSKAVVGRLPVDVVAFVAIWGLAGILWASSPLSYNYMISAPYPPNFEPYPAADGQNYDLSSQFALIGQGLFNGGKMATYFERPLYSAFLFYLHLLVGQNFAQILNLQAIIFAVFPALGYLIGKELHSRGAGFALATILTWRGVNGLLAANLLESSTQKMFLTDFPTAIGMALLLLLVIRWGKNPQINWRLAGWVSGCLGLWGFVRPHIFFLLPFAGLLALIFYFRQKRRLAAIAALMIAAYLAATLPWMQFNGSGVSLLDIYFGRVQSIIIERYPGFPFPKPGSSNLSREVASLGNFPVQLVQPQKSVPEFVLAHFLNHLLRSPLALPSTLENLKLKTIIKQAETYWRPNWDGRLSPSARVLVPLNLALIALGLGAAWKHARSSGWYPFLGMLLYSLINSLARTSGGRYLVPMDWVFILYYVLGLAVVFELLASWLNITYVTKPAAPSQPVGRGNPLRQGIVVIALLLVIGSSIPLTNILLPPRYERLEQTQVAAGLETKYLPQLGIDSADLRAFLQQPAAIVAEGRALYPRFVGRGYNSLIAGPLLEVKLYSRMSLMLIGQQGDFSVILPTSDEWFHLPNISDVLIIGCKQDYYIEGWAIINTATGQVYLRQPATELSCPLPEPVCDNNGWCR